MLKKLLGFLKLLDPRRVRALQDGWITDLKIKAPSAGVRAWSLSGGNQQRVVLAKWLATRPRVFILDGPTIGIDIASKSTIHQIVRDLAEKGIAIVIISDEIPEILHNCSRVLVMREGRIVREVPDATAVGEADLLALVSGKNGNGAVSA